METTTQKIGILSWDAPPPSSHSTGPSSQKRAEYEQVIRVLRSRPFEWACIAEEIRPKTSKTQGFPSRPSQLKDNKLFQVTSRSERLENGDRRFLTFARYIGQ